MLMMWTAEMMVTRIVASATLPSVSLACSFISGDGQEQLARRLAAFQIAMRLRRFRQRVNALDPQLQRARCHPAQHVAGAPEQLVTRRNVVTEARPCNEERAFAVQDAQIKRRNRSEERRVGKECRSRWSPY